MSRNHIFIEKKIDDQGNETEEEVEIEPENYQWALEQSTLEPADEFDDPEGNTVVIPVSSFENALAKGYKPRRPDPGAWEALKTGWKKTQAPLLQMEGFGVSGTPFGVDTVEEELAWQQNPIPYSVGRVGAGLAAAGIAGGGAYGAYRGGSAIASKATPVVKPALRAGTEAAADSWKSTMGLAGGAAAGMGMVGGDVQDVAKAAIAAGLGTAAYRGSKAAIQQFGESRQLKREIKRLGEAPRRMREAPALDPQRPPQTDSVEAIDAVTQPNAVPPPMASNNRPRPQAKPDLVERDDVIGLTRATESEADPLPVLSLVDPTEKSTFLDWLAMKAGGGGDAVNLRQKDIKKAGGMGLKRRYKGYNFDPAEEANKLAPQMREMLGNFESERSDQFRKLFKPGIDKWDAKTALPAIVKLQQTKQNAEDWGATGAKPALTAAERILTRGEMFTGEDDMLPMNQGFGFSQVGKEEQFNRLWNARKHIQETLRKAKRQEISLGSVQAERALKSVEKEIQRSMHSQPDILDADKMWAQTSEARKAFFEPLEFKPGTPSAKIDNVSLEKIFRQNETSKRFPEGIAQMREVLTTYSKKYPEAQKLLDTINNLERAMSTRDDQRFLETFRQQAGPSNPAVETGMRSMERSQEILSEAGISPRMARNPAMYLKGLTEMSVPLAQKYYGKQPWDLNTEQKNNIVRLFNWHQEQGLKATPRAEEQFMKQLMKRSK
jgi:hypothetical protein